MIKLCVPYEIIAYMRAWVVNTEDACTAAKQQLGRWVILYMTAFFFLPVNAVLQMQMGPDLQLCKVWY